MAAPLDDAQRLDGTDEGAALGYGAVGEFVVGHWKIPATRFGSGAGVSDRPAGHNLCVVSRNYPLFRSPPTRQE